MKVDAKEAGVGLLPLQKRLAILRQLKGYDQGTLAKKIGVTRQAINNWERGRAVPYPRHRARLAEVLEVTEAMVSP